MRDSSPTKGEPRAQDDASSGRAMLDRHAATLSERRKLEDFLDWVAETYGQSIEGVGDDDHAVLLTEIVLSLFEATHKVPVPGRRRSLCRQELLDEYLGIDPVQLERERRALADQAQGCA